MELGTQTGTTLPAGPDYWPVSAGNPRDVTEDPHDEKPGETRGEEDPTREARFELSRG